MTQHKTLLLVEDDDGVRRTIGMFLTMWNLEHVVTTTIEAGIMSATESMSLGKPYDAILTDYNTESRQTGLDLVAQLRNANYTNPIILMSGDIVLPDPLEEPPLQGSDLYQQIKLLPANMQPSLLIPKPVSATYLRTQFEALGIL